MPEFLNKKQINYDLEERTAKFGETIMNNQLTRLISYGLDKVFGFAILIIVNPPCAYFGRCRVFIYGE